ncbi:MAG: histidinol dehydrogenase, partial [Bacteroidota bacterium]
AVGIQKVGLYIPGGTAPLFSTVLMLGVPAQIAGCEEVVLCTPPDKEGNVHPAILYAASLVGITKIFKVGGAQAIAALAYGTESIPQVYKIFGPGNQYVTAAKTLVNKEGIAIDMPAGPSEVQVIADETAIPAFVAADLLSQAEHGADSQVLLVASNKEVATLVMEAVKIQLEALPRKELAAKALENSKVIVLSDMAAIIALTNEYAPEHLIIATENAEELADKITNAGSVFIGNYTPESAGDYASGTNHTLPTNGFAKAYSGVSLDSFVKKITFQKISPEGLQNIGPTVQLMAENELLFAHKNAVTVRLDTLN